MKLLNCLDCNDIFALNQKKRYCACRNSFGYYLDDRKTINISGNARVLGILNAEYVKSIYNGPDSGGMLSLLSFPAHDNGVRLDNIMIYNIINKMQYYLDIARDVPDVHQMLPEVNIEIV